LEIATLDEEIAKANIESYEAEYAPALPKDLRLLLQAKTT
jgi:hypothetical protein